MRFRIDRFSSILKAVALTAIAFLFLGWAWGRYQHTFLGVSQQRLRVGDMSIEQYSLGGGKPLVMLAPRETPAATLAPMARQLAKLFTVHVLLPGGVREDHALSMRAMAAALGDIRPGAWVLMDGVAEQVAHDLPRQSVLWLRHSHPSLPVRRAPTLADGVRWGVLLHYIDAVGSDEVALRRSGRLAYEGLVERCEDSVLESCASAFAGHIAAFAGLQARMPVVGAEFADRLALGGEGPAMVVVPVGSYVRGDPRFWRNDEAQPPQRVNLTHPVAVSRTEVTVAQYRAFVRATGVTSGQGCGHHDVDEIWRMDADRTWERPGFAQDDAHPAVCMHWPAAQEYVRWLSAQTGAPYRLPSENELEFLIRAGHTGDYGIAGVRPSVICRYMNGAEESLKVSYRNRACSDGYAYTAPAARYPANDFGLHDMHGNVWEFTQDCSTFLNRGWLQFFLRTATAQAPWTRDRCDYHVTRGGAWLSSTQFLKTHTRREVAWDTPLTNVGIRLIREFEPVSTQ